MCACIHSCMHASVGWAVGRSLVYLLFCYRCSLPRCESMLSVYSTVHFIFIVYCVCSYAPCLLAVWKNRPSPFIFFTQAQQKNGCVLCVLLREGEWSVDCSVGCCLSSHCGYCIISK